MPDTGMMPMTREELNALCADGLRRGLDPVEILLRLR